MKRRKRRQRPSIAPPARIGPVTDRRILLVDDGPLRRRAAQECTCAMEKLENARAALRHFEHEDKPAFGRWTAATFGTLLTQLRDNARVIAEQQDLALEVEAEMLWSGAGPRRAYATVMKRRENPDPTDDFAGGDSAWDDDQGARGEEGKTGGGSDATEPADEVLSREERQEMFEDFVTSVLGVNLNGISAGEYARLFAQFEGDFFGSDPPENPTKAASERAPAAEPEQARIKEIYRTLVRRLHPDLKADGEAAVAAVWHEVQEAYETRNLVRLETLLALIEVQSDPAAIQSSLSQQRRALAEINRSIQSIQRSIHEAKRDPAWGFLVARDHGALEKRVRRELEASLAEQRWVLSDLSRILGDWSRPPRPRKKKPGKHGGPPQNAKPKPVQADLFPF